MATMDWARDNDGLSDYDLDTVFQYAPSSSTIVQMLTRDKYKAEITPLITDKDWASFLELDLCHLKSQRDSGLVLLLAKRPGEQALPIQSLSKVSSDEWEKLVGDKLPSNGGVERNKTFSPVFGAVPPTPSDVRPPRLAPATGKGGHRSLRTLPFSFTTFKRITQCFYSHGSIAKVISRADVPLFSAEPVEMDGELAYVYNCRSSNAWPGDLALSATYFPERGLTFAILYGCTFEIEADIIKRLGRVGAEALHPLLMPGIFAELERSRHLKEVRLMVIKVETHTFQLDLSKATDDPEEAERRSNTRRNDWLDTTYLRNGLVSWSQTHLGRMAEHAVELGGHGEINVMRFAPPDESVAGRERRRLVGRRIERRVRTIADEYADWIRDCTMRVDGMAMATQWAQGETNVEIAMATKRDSKHMRSIALLTMVFLPGTFLASFFSMSFFHWFNDSGQETGLVSSYFWIYILLTLVLTGATIGSWWYFVIFRPARRREGEDEEEDDASIRMDRETDGRIGARARIRGVRDYVRRRLPPKA